MRVVLYGGVPGWHEWYVAGPLDLADGEQEYIHHRVTHRLITSGSTGDGWGPMPTWVYRLTDEVKMIDGESVRVMRQDRVAEPPATTDPADEMAQDRMRRCR